MVKERIWVNLLRIIELFTQKMDIKHSKIWVGNKVRDPEKIYYGSRIQGAKRHRIRIRNTD